MLRRGSIRAHGWAPAALIGRNDWRRRSRSHETSEKPGRAHASPRRSFVHKFATRRAARSEQAPGLKEFPSPLFLALRSLLIACSPEGEGPRGPASSAKLCTPGVRTVLGSPAGESDWPFSFGRRARDAQRARWGDEGNSFSPRVASESRRNKGLVKRVVFRGPILAFPRSGGRNRPARAAAVGKLGARPWLSLRN